jgi:hypothetical protein
MVKQILGITKEINPLDITDAMAVAITHAQRVKLDMNKQSQIVRKNSVKEKSLLVIENKCDETV